MERESRSADMVLADGDDDHHHLLSVVIVNYRTPKLIVDCIETLLPQLRAIDSRIVIVDNDSADDSVESIERWMGGLPNGDAERIIFACAPRNGGFAYGNNFGIVRAPAHFYLLLNSDTLVRDGAIHRLLHTARTNPDAGLIGPRLEYRDERPQESCFRRHGVISELLRGAQLSLLYSVFRKYEVALAVDDRRSRIDWTSFACVLIRGEVINDVGLLDERYFMYFEDAEYCLRAGRAGWRIFHEPRARVVHLRGGTSPVKAQALKKAALPRYYYESRSRYFRQRGGRPYLVLANLMWYLGRALSLAKLLRGRRDRSTVDGEWRDLWIDADRPCEPRYTGAYGAKDGVPEETAA